MVLLLYVWVNDVVISILADEPLIFGKTMFRPFRQYRFAHCRIAKPARRHF